MQWWSEAPIRCTPQKGSWKHPHYRALGQTVVTCLIGVYIMIRTSGGPSGHLFLVAGASCYRITWLIGPSRLEGALGDLTQFGVLWSFVV